MSANEDGGRMWANGVPMTVNACVSAGSRRVWSARRGAASTVERVLGRAAVAAADQLGRATRGDSRGDR